MILKIIISGKNIVGTFAGIMPLNNKNYRVVLSLGSNIGNRQHFLEEALRLLGEKCGEIKALSSVFQTQAWGDTEQSDYLNMAVVFKTCLPPGELMNKIVEVEISLGRIRNKKWERRTIDIDILFFGNQIIQTPGLWIPHPRIQERKFVLAPLAEILPDFIHPLLKKTSKELLASCTDKLLVHKIDGLLQTDFNTLSN